MNCQGIGVAAIFLALLGGGCTTAIEVPDKIRVVPVPAVAPAPLALAPTVAEQLTGRRDMKWGLALSGGGIRSALFSVGVLKALFDNGVLDRLDAISSVSGGGYASYWLFSNERFQGTASSGFGTSLLGNSEFPQALCSLSVHANFVPYSKLARIPFAGSLRRGSVDVYERSLRRTFGQADPEGSPISDWKDLVTRTDVPLPIMNATHVDARANIPWHQRLLEFTPLEYGSDGTGRIPWGEQNLETLKAVAVSGAALSPLGQKLALRHPLTRAPDFFADDGGRSENLGAFALIARGVANVVISDAEHDPRYEFEGYRVLRAGLQRHGLRLTIPDIDDYLLGPRLKPYDRALAMGTVIRADTGVQISRIYYVKAMMPDLGAAQPDQLARHVLDDSANDSDGQRSMAAWQANLGSAKDPDGLIDCARLKGRILAMPAWAANSVGTYWAWHHRAWRPKLMKVGATAINTPAAFLDFPHYSTSDQSLYLDQAWALVGLGYLEAALVK